MSLKSLTRVRDLKGDRQGLDDGEWLKMTLFVFATLVSVWCRCAVDIWRVNLGSLHKSFAHIPAASKVQLTRALQKPETGWEAQRGGGTYKSKKSLASFLNDQMPLALRPITIFP